MIRVFRPIPVERLKLLVFDLDGTLIDSAQDLCNSVNAALGECNLRPLPDPAIAGFVGNGAPMLMRRSLALAGNIDPGNVSEDTFAKAYAFFCSTTASTSSTSLTHMKVSSTRSGLCISFTTLRAVLSEPWPCLPTSPFALLAASARGWASLITSSTSMVATVSLRKSPIRSAFARSWKRLAQLLRRP